MLTQLRGVTYKDYQQVKEMLTKINSQFDSDYVDSHAHHDEQQDHLDRSPTTTAVTATTIKHKKGFTVGSLI